MTVKTLGLRLGFFFSALVVLALDQLTKDWVRNNLLLGHSLPEDGFFRLTHIQNSGAVFGLMADPTLLIIITSLVALVILFLHLFHPALNSLFLSLGMGLLLGGAVGNLMDRLMFGYVTDFVDIRVWPVFNLADSATVVSIVMLCAYFLFPSLRGKDSTKLHKGALD